jgi:regulator of sirC expression with transglutaminase-like and TPR domain
MSPDLAAFADAVGPAGGPVPLLPAAFAVARLGHPDLDPAPYLAQIETWGQELAERVSGLSYPMPRVRALTAFVFDELGFTGNRDTYYDAENSYLNDVIDRRTGIPISLSVVTLGIAARAGLPLRGVGFPGHFLVRYVGDEDSFILFDPFVGGEILSEPDCQARLKALYAGEATYDPKMIQPVSSRQIIARMLVNLKGIFLHNKAHQRALDVVEYLLALDPDRFIEHRDKGMLLLSLHEYPQALESLSRYLDRQIDAPDAGVIRRLIDQIRSRYGLD